MLIEIFKALLYLTAGLLLGYFAHIYQIKQRKFDTQEDRLLSKVAEIEKVLSRFKELEWQQQRQLRVKERMQRIREKFSAIDKSSETIETQFEEFKTLAEAHKVDNEFFSNFKTQFDQMVADQEVKKTLLQQDLDETESEIDQLEMDVETITKDIHLSDSDTIAELIDSTGQLRKNLSDLSHLILLYDKDSLNN